MEQPSPAESLPINDIFVASQNTSEGINIEQHNTVIGDYIINKGKYLYVIEVTSSLQSPTQRGLI
jgi:hypothetical protein